MHLVFKMQMKGNNDHLNGQQRRYVAKTRQFVPLCYSSQICFFFKIEVNKCTYLVFHLGQPKTISDLQELTNPAIQSYDEIIGNEIPLNVGYRLEQ